MKTTDIYSFSFILSRSQQKAEKITQKVYLCSFLDEEVAQDKNEELRQVWRLYQLAMTKGENESALDINLLSNQQYSFFELPDLWRAILFLRIKLGLDFLAMAEILSRPLPQLKAEWVLAFESYAKLLPLTQKIEAGSVKIDDVIEESRYLFIPTLKKLIFMLLKKKKSVVKAIRYILNPSNLLILRTISESALSARGKLKG